MPTIRGFFWPVEVIGAILTAESPEAPESDESASEGEPAPVFAAGQAPWWRAEYPELLGVLGDAPESTLRTDFRTGPGGGHEVHLALQLAIDGSVVLHFDSPGEGLVEPDATRPGVGERVVFVLRDDDADGIPDAYRWESAVLETPAHLTPFSGQEGEEMMFQVWTVGVGYSVNYFLHGLRTALPR